MSGEVLLAVIAHPDDEHLCGAGTLAVHAAERGPVHVVCATRGEYGPIADPVLATREALPGVRERELRASCAELGVSNVSFLDLPDAGVAWAAEERDSLTRLVRTIRELRPRTLITFGADGVYGHSDHVAVHALTVRARAAAGDAAVTTAGFPAHRVPRMFYPVWTQTWVRELLAALPGTSVWDIDPSHFTAQLTAQTICVDVTSVLERKLRALHFHRTQLTPQNTLGKLSGALARKFLGNECFQCADGVHTALFEQLHK